jgi:hypothetical protein
MEKTAFEQLAAIFHRLKFAAKLFSTRLCPDHLVFSASGADCGIDLVQNTFPVL